MGLRADFGAALSKDMFSMMRTMNGFSLENIAGTNQNYSLSNQTLNMKAYAEVGLGYSRRITEKLTVGARVKVLLGLARAEMNINQFDLDWKYRILIMQVIRIIVLMVSYLLLTGMARITIIQLMVMLLLL